MFLVYASNIVFQATKYVQHLGSLVNWDISQVQASKYESDRCFKAQEHNIAMHGMNFFPMWLEVRKKQKPKYH